MAQSESPAPRKRQAPTGTALIGKALDVLEAIADCPNEADHVELIRRTGISRPTLYRILSALTARGLVRNDGTRRGFTLGYQFLEMATQVWAGSDLTTIAAPELRRLRDITGETAYLAVTEGGGVLSISRVQGAHTQRSQTALGTVKPMHCTSQGKAILAHLPEAQAQALLAGPLAALTPRTITDRHLLEIELAKTRMRGYALDDEEILLGTRCVGAPILDARGQPLAAISVAGPSFRITLQRAEYLGQEVQEAARQIAARITPEPAAPANRSRFVPITAQPNFTGIAPQWDAARGMLTWADRYASALFEYGGDSAPVASSGFPNRIDAMALSRAAGPIVFLESELLRPMSGTGAALAGFRVTAACCDRQDQLWVAVQDRIGQGGAGQTARLARMRGDGSLADAITLPGAANAITPTPDGTGLYLCSPAAGTIHLFDIRSQRLRLFVNLPRAAGRPAALAFDTAGNPWVALLDGWSVVRLDQTGEIVQTLALPVRDATGLCFGGPAGRLLYVTTTRHELRREDLTHAPLSGHLLVLNPDRVTG